MLTSLSIRNIVLIEKLDLNFGAGLTVFTGETGAGKSIVLDSLTLALGSRGDSRLVRSSASEGYVAARFEIASSQGVFDLLKEQGLDPGDGLVLRRVQLQDGRTRAYINDIPVTVQLLRQVGQLLVEVHGQHDDRALTDPSSHRNLLDLFGGLVAEVREVSRLWTDAQDRHVAAREAEDALEKARRDADYLRHALKELETLAPEAHEEQALAERRQALLAVGKLRGDLEDALSNLSAPSFPSTALNSAIRRIERQPQLPQSVRDIVAAMERVLIEADEAYNLTEAELRRLGEAGDIEAIEERLFKLREVARKYRVAPGELHDLHARFAVDVDSLDAGEARVATLRREAEEAARAYAAASDALSASRKDAAERLDKAVARHLKPLKLAQARFITQIEPIKTDGIGVAGGPFGRDSVVFYVQTNPGSNPGPMMKVASGGELARFILGLKVALSQKTNTPVMIFDEIDTGVGGATAAAIGDKLASLGRTAQVIAVTHSPQVAAYANAHYRLYKTSSEGTKHIAVATCAEALDAEGRREEIARMLAGADITDEARAAAARLIGAK
jgi:DNA repair protein RecN (Recombination protein N)